MVKEFKRFMTVKELAEIIEVHYKTLASWMCNFNLSTFVYTKPLKYGKSEQYYKLNENSVNALKEYLKKRTQNITQPYEKNPEDFINRLFNVELSADFNSLLSHRFTYINQSQICFISSLCQNCIGNFYGRINIRSSYVSVSISIRMSRLINFIT